MLNFKFVIAVEDAHNSDHINRDMARRFARTKESSFKRPGRGPQNVIATILLPYPFGIPEVWNVLFAIATLSKLVASSLRTPSTEYGSLTTGDAAPGMFGVMSAR